MANDDICTKSDTSSTQMKSNPSRWQDFDPSESHVGSLMPIIFNSEFDFQGYVVSKWLETYMLAVVMYRYAYLSGRLFLSNHK
jgi:hypothetical protein